MSGRGGGSGIHLHTIVEAIALLGDLRPTDRDLREALPAKADYDDRFPRDPGHCAPDVRAALERLTIVSAALMEWGRAAV